MSSRTRVLPDSVMQTKSGIVGIFFGSLAIYAKKRKGRLRPFYANAKISGRQMRLSVEAMYRLWDKLDKAEIERLLREDAFEVRENPEFRAGSVLLPAID